MTHAIICLALLFLLSFSTLLRAGSVLFLARDSHVFSTQIQLRSTQTYRKGSCMTTLIIFFLATDPKW